MTTLNRTTILVRNPDLISTNMDGDTVMMSIERGEYFGLGGIGGFVWDLLETPISVEALIQAVCNEYEVEEAKCESDILHFADLLLKNNTISSC